MEFFNLEIFIEWEHHKHDNILTYRDKQFKNFFTGRLADKNEKRWIDDTDPWLRKLHD